MIAYDPEELEKLAICEDAQSWHKNQIIDDNQWKVIQNKYSSSLYHPPIWLRALLFIATIIGINAGLGLFASLLIFDNIDNEQFIRVFIGLLGVGYILILENVFIKSKNHYKSGVSEAFLFLGVIQIIIAVYWDDDPNMFLTLLILIAGSVLALRYLNLIGTFIAIISFAYLVFDLLYQIGGIIQAIIPFVFVILFGSLYIWSQKIQPSLHSTTYKDHFILMDVLLLILCYLGGNYFVVRELSIEMMGLHLNPGEDIPFAFVFYFLTSCIPLIYLVIGLRNKSIILIRTGILILFASVITFKFYYSSGHTEITLTLSGSLVLGFSIWALNYLKSNKNGYTRETLLSDKWSDLNAESIVISSTMGGNTDLNDQSASTEYGGGKFGGGGAGGQY